MPAALFANSDLEEEWMVVGAIRDLIADDNANVVAISYRNITAGKGFAEISFSLACTRFAAGNPLGYRMGKQLTFPFVSFHMSTTTVKS